MTGLATDRLTTNDMRGDSTEVAIHRMIPKMRAETRNGPYHTGLANRASIPCFTKICTRFCN